MRLGPLLALAAVVASSPAGAQRIIGARGQWAAIDFGGHCEASSKAVRSAGASESAPRAGFRFDRGGPRRGEFHARLGRIPRPGSTILLIVGDHPFMLVGGGGWAWSRSGAQAAAIIAAVRSAGGMRIEARDQRGRRSVDRYLLDGAPTAIDAAAAACLRPA